MALIKTAAAAIFTLFCALAFIPVGLSAFILSYLGLRKPMSWVSYRMAQAWARILILMTGSTTEVTGRENIPRQGSVCFMSNHQGILDVILALAYIGRPFGFIAKKELLLLPFINIWILLLGGLFIDRNNIRKALKTINHGIRKIQEGASILIFPEGTRSKGRGLLPFRSGASKLAINSLVPVVPMAITGTYELF